MATQSVLWPAAAAAAPIALILGLMLGRQWSAARAGAAGLLLAWALALAWFGFRAPAGQATVLARHAGVLAEAGFLALGILWILLPALALHAHQQRCGATDALRADLARVSTQAPLQVLLLGWCLGLFLEGAAGFGTPIALVAPLLVGLGVPALTAVVLALLGHAAGVCFGALGTPVLAQAALTGVPALDIAWRSAALQAVLGGVLMVFFMRTLATAGLGRVGAGWALLATAGFLLPSLGLAAWLGPELATLGAALLSALAVVALLRVRQQHGREGMAAPGLRRALWPYAVLVLAVLATRAVPALAHTLNTVVVEWQLFGRYTGRLQPLTHPGTLLFLARRTPAGCSAARPGPAAAAGPGAVAAGGAGPAGDAVPVAPAAGRRHGAGAAAGGGGGAGPGLAAAGPGAGCAGQLRHRVSHRVERAVQQPAGADGTGPGPAGGLVAGRPEPGRGGGQHRLPAQHRGRRRHGGPGRA